MAEGTSLLRMHTAYTRIVSSNLTVSARTTSAEIQQRPETPDLHTGAGGFLFGGVRPRPVEAKLCEGMFEGMKTDLTQSIPSKTPLNAVRPRGKRSVFQEESCLSYLFRSLSFS